MDIEFLLLLQNFRETTNNILTPFFLWMGNLAIGFVPIAAVAMVYWALDRQAGKRILAGFSAGLLMNGFLKLLFQVPRPWIRDSRVVPYGDSLSTATGYSFPSGHSTYATSQYGGIAWWQKDSHKILAAVLFLSILIVLFSRNYLGVHTSQDVIVDFIVTSFLMFAMGKMEDWTNQDPHRDWIIMAAGVVISVAAGVYYCSLDISPVYDSSGALAVDPEKMVADSFSGIGALSAFAICRFFERRYFHFDTELTKKFRLIAGIIALIPLGWWCYAIFDICKPYSRALGCFATHAGIIVWFQCH